MKAKLATLWDLVQEMYQVDAAKVPYHGWHHVKFVVEKASDFLVDLRADETLTVASALVHDFNYLVAENSGRGLRQKILAKSGFDDAFAERVEAIILEARTSHRHADISAEAKALSDGDTAYKALPTTPLMCVDYLAETGATLRDLAEKIVSEQTPLREKGIYFYSARAQQTYAEWAGDNIELWTRVLRSFDDADVVNVLRERIRGVS